MQKKHKNISKATEQVSSVLIQWYRKNARDLPWRHTRDPYPIWISEVILQQTTVAQGEAYYHRFLKKFPTLAALASAEQDAVLKLWEGLGYYSRARNLHAAAQDVMNRFDGQFPDTYENIISLKGIGPYAAAAIGSFVYGIPRVVVDGNVLRVISRLYGIEEAVDLPATKKQITLLAQTLLDTQDPAEFNQAIMEFGAINCTYKKPSCATCPLRQFCTAHAKKIVDQLPLKSKKIKKTTRRFHFLILEDPNNCFLVDQRTGKDVWQGLFQFPLLESNKLDHELSLHDFPHIEPIKGKLVGVSELYKQTLTHQYIQACFYHFRAEASLKRHNSYKVISKSEIKDYAWPKIIVNYLKDRELL